uniref:Uncharacterized protein n=1 Tax=Anguilla anguilla TaxID=7936 RepID=A0A0E9RJE4_ANGAN
MCSVVHLYHYLFFSYHNLLSLITFISVDECKERGGDSAVMNFVVGC